jgi:hypothetical protein
MRSARWCHRQSRLLVWGMRSAESSSASLSRLLVWGGAIARYPRQLQSINCNQSSLRELNHEFMLV